jgi:uncharacterized caspase-like protein
MASTQHGFTNGYALLIGVGYYRSPMQSLPATANDAKEFYDVLTDPDRCHYPTAHVNLLINESPGINSASRSRILNGLHWLEEKTTSSSTIVVYFSGHGLSHVVPHTSDSMAVETYYLLPSDYDPTDLEHTGLSIDELAKALKQIAAQKILIILDCCHAGGFADLNAIPSAPTDLLTQAADPNLVYNKIHSQLSEGKGQVCLFSSDKNQHSWLMEDKQSSVFTHYLLEAFRGKANGADDRVCA